MNIPTSSTLTMRKDDSTYDYVGMTNYGVLITYYTKEPPELRIDYPTAGQNTGIVALSLKPENQLLGAMLDIWRFV